MVAREQVCAKQRVSAGYMCFSVYVCLVAVFFVFLNLNLCLILGLPVCALMFLMFKSVIMLLLKMN